MLEASLSQATNSRAAAVAALENGQLRESQAKLGELMRRNPRFPGAADLSRRLALELWKEKLPLRFQAKHDHRIGECTGNMTE